MDGLRVRNVTSRSFGVEVVTKTTGEVKVSNLICVNDPVPAKTTQRFGTLDPNQEVAEIRVMENIDPAPTAKVEDSKEIGTATLQLPGGLPADSPIEITLSLDEQGRLHVTGVDLTGKISIESDFNTTRVISKEETEQAVARSKQLAVS